MIKLYILILLSNTTQIDKCKSIYYLCQVQELEITCKIIRYETGHLQCHKKKTICSLDYNNLFGFRYNNDYLKFNEYNESVKYYIRWQNKYYSKFKKIYPERNYYQFIKWINYCDRMDDYIKTIKKL